MLVLACLPSAEVGRFLESRTSESSRAASRRSMPPQTLAHRRHRGRRAVRLGADSARHLRVERLRRRRFSARRSSRASATGYLFNLRQPIARGDDGVVAAALFFSGVALMVFAFEGAICLLMAAPSWCRSAYGGAPIGKFLADRRRAMHGGLGGRACWSCRCLRWSSRSCRDERVRGGEHGRNRRAARDGVAAGDRFPEITERPEWFFRMGVPAPRVRGSREGVGAMRECLFTTVGSSSRSQPGTAPRRLAFDVREQPEPMFEMTPYRDIHPPHLDGAFRSTRGEFELAELPNGRTRLNGPHVVHARHSSPRVLDDLDRLDCPPHPPARPAAHQAADGNGSGGVSMTGMTDNLNTPPESTRGARLLPSTAALHPSSADMDGADGRDHLGA